MHCARHKACTGYFSIHKMYTHSKKFICILDMIGRIKSNCFSKQYLRTRVYNRLNLSYFSYKLYFCQNYWLFHAFKNNVSYHVLHDRLRTPEFCGIFQQTSFIFAYISVLYYYSVTSEVVCFALIEFRMS